MAHSVRVLLFGANWWRRKGLIAPLISASVTISHSLLQLVWGSAVSSVGLRSQRQTAEYAGSWAVLLTAVSVTAWCPGVPSLPWGVSVLHVAGRRQFRPLVSWFVFWNCCSSSFDSRCLWDVNSLLKGLFYVPKFKWPEIRSDSSPGSNTACKTSNNIQITSPG